LQSLEVAMLGDHVLRATVTPLTHEIFHRAVYGGLVNVHGPANANPDARALTSDLAKLCATNAAFFSTCRVRLDRITRPEPPQNLDGSFSMRGASADTAV
jgi:hypothetical protein